MSQKAMAQDLFIQNNALEMKCDERVIWNKKEKAKNCTRRIWRNKGIRRNSLLWKYYKENTGKIK